MKVAIVGGTGRMGQWFARFFQEKKFEVCISGRSNEKTRQIAKQLEVMYASTNKELVQGADIVLVAVPIEKTVSILQEIYPYLRKGTIICDIASVKGDIVNILKKARNSGARAVSLHPLFGPGASTIVGRKMLVIPVYEDPALIREVTDIFEREGAIISIIENAEIHDRMMAFTLSFPHFLNILFGMVLEPTDINYVKECGGTTFALQLVIAESVASENPDFYSSVQLQNPSFHKLLESFISNAKKLSRSIRNQDKKSFIKSFDQVKTYFSEDPDFEKAYSKFYRMFESI